MNTDTIKELEEIRFAVAQAAACWHEEQRQPPMDKAFWFSESHALCEAASRRLEKLIHTLKTTPQDSSP